MMKKRNLVVAIVALALSWSCLANDIEFGYSETKSTFMKNAKYTIGVARHPIEYTGVAKYQESNEGYSVMFNAEADYDINPFNVFVFGTYKTDTILDIANRLDLGVGGGYEIYNDYTSRHKVSYAVMNRASRWVSSYRYKYTFDTKLLGVKAIFNFITPDGELQADISSDLKLFNNFAVGLKHEYISTPSNRNFFQSVYLKIKL